jgi:hypothetical protein
MVARVALATVAVLAIAWLAVLERDYRVGHHAALRLFEPGKPSAARVHDTADRLERAEFLSPDTRWDLGLSRYYLDSGHRRESLRLADSLVRREPDNIDAWYVLYLGTRTAEPRRAAEAVARIRHLDPRSGF